MKSFFLTSLVVCVFAIGAQKVGEDVTVFARKGLHIRKAPNRSAAILRMMAPGSRLRVLQVLPAERTEDDISGRWLLVQADSQKGWAFSGFTSRWPFPVGCEGLESYAKQHFRVLNSKLIARSECPPFKSPHDECITKEDQLTRGAVLHEVSFYEGSSTVLVLPDTSLYEGFFIASQCSRTLKTADMYYEGPNRVWHKSRGDCEGISVNRRGRAVHISLYCTA